MRAKDMLGRRGEELAAEYLQRHGMQILDRNWRCRAGELDIVALDARVLVAAEVKTRRSLDYGHPFEAVTAAKLARLGALGRAWRSEHRCVLPLRVDVVAVLDDGEGEPCLEHLRGVG